MNKKYTVFLSSTFVDLREERREVIHALLEMDCIPRSMETFPADDNEQFEFIKSVIDECDYFILIIAGRYGNICRNGMSFTEMEYRYAIQKGIPIMTFIHSNIGSIALNKSERSEKNREKLNEFIKYVSNNKVVKYWSGKDELAREVSSTMVSAMKKYPAKGWVRGKSCEGGNFSVFAGETIDLCSENTNLLDELFEIAVFFKEKGELEKSKLFFECCMILSPEKEEVLREYGGLYYNNCQYEKALFLWQKLINVRKSCRNYYLCALVYKNLGNYSQAKEMGILALECPDDGFQSWVNEHIINILS